MPSSRSLRASRGRGGREDRGVSGLLGMRGEEMAGGVEAGLKGEEVLVLQQQQQRELRELRELPLQLLVMEKEGGARAGLVSEGEAGGEGEGEEGEGEGPLLRLLQETPRH